MSRQGADPAAARPHRLHLPVLQPAADADRRGEHRAAAAAGRREGRRRLGERDHREGRAQRPAQAPPVRALRRPAAASRDRPRAGVAADRDVRRRADRQPRLAHQRRDPCPAARHGDHLRTDHRDGHARCERRVHGRSAAVPGRRPDRPRPGPRRAGRRPGRDGGGQCRCDAGRPPGAVGPQAAHGADGAFDRPRHVDDHRHVRPPRPDQQRVLEHLPREQQGHRRRAVQEDGLHVGQRRGGRAAARSR